jgi:predicted kinase
MQSSNQIRPLGNTTPDLYGTPRGTASPEKTNQDNIVSKVNPITDKPLETLDIPIIYRQIIILRGIPGSGKTFFANRILKEYLPISTDILAAEQEATLQKVKLTPDNIKQLANDFFTRNQAIPDDKYPLKRKALVTMLHKMLHEKYEQHLKSNPKENIVIDNTSIRAWESMPYYDIAEANNIEKENISIIDINPFYNPLFRTALEEVMEEKGVELISNTKCWPDLTFQSKNDNRKIYTDSRYTLGKEIICTALNNVMLSPLPLKYMINRLTAYIEELNLEKITAANTKDQGANSLDWRSDTNRRTQNKNGYSRDIPPRFSNWRNNNSQQPQNSNGRLGFRNEGYGFKPSRGSDSLDWRK